MKDSSIPTIVETIIVGKTTRDNKKHNLGYENPFLVSAKPSLDCLQTVSKKNHSFTFDYQ